MKMCMPHWDELKQAIRDRGLWELVAQDSKAAIRRFEQEIQGTATDLTYDPLMAANTMISTAALQGGGLYLLTDDFCPLCEAEKHIGEGTAKHWIKGCTDSILEYCREKNLVANPPEQKG